MLRRIAAPTPQHLDDLASEDAILESMTTTADAVEVVEATDEAAGAAEAVAELAEEPAGDVPTDQVVSEEEPPESSAV